MDVFNVAQTMVNHIKATCPEDIAIVAYYGSYAQGTATKRSDLDFFFIPATSKGYSASLSFVLNDISFDFWPISWERAEKMASFDDPFTTIIADCQFLYVRSEADRLRFMKLRESISSNQEPSNGQKLTEKAESQLNDVYVHLYKMSCARNLENNITFYRTEAQLILTKIFQCLALLNRTYFTRGWGKNIEQTLQLPIKPNRLEHHYNVILYSRISADIRLACEQLTADTLELVLTHKESYAGTPSYRERMNGFYEEAKGTLDKILTACESNDYPTAFFAAIGVQDEIARFLFFAEKGQWPSELNSGLDYQDSYNRLGFPDLAALVDPEKLFQLQAAVEHLNVQLESHLYIHAVPIHRFQNINQLEEFLLNRSAAGQ
ncbi:hypothetical protein [Paenibacillus wynnii]|uniref:hypothetical protein n=1 Tax=Paenibacillus wynnii TaxID=268407 RepID=UPI00279304BC|nr:hypothetical protein [Paenibacillus wynnii]MDQ0196677.1 hypothetical protein [Paenibacillus wynnii]